MIWRKGRPSQSSAGLCRTFQRILTSHVTGSDGRRPFEPEEEEAILKVIRKKHQRPAFQSTTLTIGCKGFRSKGYHERNQKSLVSSSATESFVGQKPIVLNQNFIKVNLKPAAA